jgi:C-terminal processing protease CtpA/Prc
VEVDDIVTRVDNIDIQDKSLDQINDLIRGKAPTS